MVKIYIYECLHDSPKGFRKGIYYAVKKTKSGDKVLVKGDSGEWKLILFSVLNTNFKMKHKFSVQNEREARQFDIGGIA